MPLLILVEGSSIYLSFLFFPVFIVNNVLEDDVIESRALHAELRLLTMTALDGCKKWKNEMKELRRGCHIQSVSKDINIDVQ